MKAHFVPRQACGERAQRARRLRSGALAERELIAALVLAAQRDEVRPPHEERRRLVAQVARHLRGVQEHLPHVARRRHERNPRERVQRLFVHHHADHRALVVVSAEDLDRDARRACPVELVQAQHERARELFAHPVLARHRERAPEVTAADVLRDEQQLAQQRAHFVWRIAGPFAPVLGQPRQRREQVLDARLGAQLHDHRVERVRVRVHVEAPDAVDVRVEQRGDRARVDARARGLFDGGEAEQELACVSAGRAEDAVVVAAVDAGLPSVDDHGGELEPAHRAGVADVRSNVFEREDLSLARGVVVGERVGRGHHVERSRAEHLVAASDQTLELPLADAAFERGDEAHPEHLEVLREQRRALSAARDEHDERRGRQALRELCDALGGNPVRARDVPQRTDDLFDRANVDDLDATARFGDELSRDHRRSCGVAPSLRVEVGPKQALSSALGGRRFSGGGPCHTGRDALTEPSARRRATARRSATRRLRGSAVEPRGRGSRARATSAGTGRR